MTIARWISTAAAAAMLAACSTEAPEENVFKGQTDAIGKAEDVNKLIEEAAEQQREAIDAQGR
jgi:outer membrane PBP1 activator LpoA protein